MAADRDERFLERWAVAGARAAQHVQLDCHYADRVLGVDVLSTAGAVASLALLNRNQAANRMSASKSRMAIAIPVLRRSGDTAGSAGAATSLPCSGVPAGVGCSAS